MLVGFIHLFSLEFEVNIINIVQPNQIIFTLQSPLSSVPPSPLKMLACLRATRFLEIRQALRLTSQDFSFEFNFLSFYLHPIASFNLISPRLSHFNMHHDPSPLP